MRLPALLLAAGRWLLALAVPAAALGLTLLIQPLVDQLPSPPFVAAVLVVAWVGGFRPALLATAVSVLAINYYFLEPRHSLWVTPPELAWLVMFVSVSMIIAWLVTNRAESRRRMEASARHLRFVTDAAPVMIYYVDAGGRYGFANRPFAQRYGLTPEAIVGRRVEDVVGPVRYPTLAPHLGAALAGRPTTFETTTADADGTVRQLSATYVPDVAGGDVRGVVAVITDVTERTRAEDERVRLLAVEQARRRETEAIAELGRVLTRGLEVEPVAERLAELARGMLRAVTATVYRVDPESGDLVCLAISGDMATFRVGGVVSRHAGAAGAAVRRGRPVTTDNVLGDPAIELPESTRAWVERATYRAVLAVPLRLKGRTIGAFALGDRLGRVFTSDEVRLVEAFADHAAVALENARLYTEAEARRREAELLAELARAVNGSLELDSVLHQAAAAAKDLCDADLARIALWDAARQGLTYRYTVGTRVSGHEHVLLTPGKGLAGEVLATGRPVRTANVLEDPRLHPDYAPMIRAEGSRAVMVAPIRIGERIEGLIYVDNRRPRAFTDRDEAVLMRLADHAAIALGNARLFAGEQGARGEAEARARRARLLADVSRVLASSTHYEKTLDGVAALVVPAHADWCMVHLARRDGSVRRIAVAHADPAHAALAAETRSLPPTPHWLRDAGPMIDALRGGQSVFVPDVRPAELERLTGGVEDRRIFAALGPRSLLMVPLVARGRALGSMTWARLAGRERCTVDDLRLAEDLAGRIALAIDNARLYRQAERARVEAEEANRAKDEFLAVLSHELRTPLTAMLGWLRLLRGGQLAGDKVAQALEVVERNTRTQAQLINDLLDVSRIIAGKLALDLYPVDLLPILEEAVELSRTEAEAKAVTLELAADRRAGIVLGDPLRLGQIVANLITNAVKFTPSGGRVALTLAREPEHALLTVADSGIGIDPEILPRIFDRFRQADSTITRRHGGLGLGLAIVRHLTELHGGTVQAASAGSGRGST
ncbi:MAG TPA: GAF domain-containing protein, partial [Methylomirabilota bacterium]|nr:GAF domain-containing protein [Methylomirabilota bacterium]